MMTIAELTHQNEISELRSQQLADRMAPKLKRSCDLFLEISNGQREFDEDDWSILADCLEINWRAMGQATISHEIRMHSDGANPNE